MKTRPTLAERYDAAGALTAAGKAAFRRPALEAACALFRPGDVVFDDNEPDVLGVVTEAGPGVAIRIVFAHGGGAGGPGLLPGLWHREPRVNVSVTKGMLGCRGWNREQAVKAALRKAHVP